MDKYCTICKANELLTPQETANKICNVCFGKRSEILEKICIALNANDVDAMSKLVESAFDAGHTAEEVKEVVSNCMSHPNFDVIYEFCRAMNFEENKRAPHISVVDDVRE